MVGHFYPDAITFGIVGRGGLRKLPELLYVVRRHERLKQQLCLRLHEFWAGQPRRPLAWHF
jgi:hypothetical protein